MMRALLPRRDRRPVLLLMGLAVALLVPAPIRAQVTERELTPFSLEQLRRVPPQLVAREPLVSGATLGLAALLVSPRDDAWTTWARDDEPLGADGRDIGYWTAHRYTVGTQILALTAAGWLGGNRHLRDTGLLLGQSQALSAGLTQLLKITVGRERPDRSNDRSFPSGHSTAAWTTAVVLQERYGPWLGLPAHLVALYVGLSRMQDGKHRPSDVIAGFAVAQWTSRAVLRSADARRPASISWLSPAWNQGPAIELLSLRF